MDNCIFCKIAAKQIPSQIIYEDDEVMAFLDINPINFGHTLIIPKEHFADILETPDDLMCKCFLKAKELAPKVIKAVKADYFHLSVAGQDVAHFHVHIIPRLCNDGLETWPPKKTNNEELNKIKEEILKEI